MKVHGRCHCGAIAFDADVQPGTVMICHCLDCQMLGGSVFRTNIPAPAAGFRMLKGTPQTYVKIGDSGARRLHAFCGHCGTSVYSCAVDNPQSYNLRLGTLDQREALGRPRRQIWVKRRLSWMPKLEGVAEVEGQP